MVIGKGTHLKVGIFVLVGVILFVISVILLSGHSNFFTSSNRYFIKMEQVQGLARGSVVSVSGVKSGNVRNLEFIPGTQLVKVTLSINSDTAVRITSESVASIKTQGALGDKYIYIDPGPMGSPPLKPGDYIDIDPQGDLLDVISNRSAELENIIEVINEVHKLLKGINQDDRSALFMKNLVSASSKLDDFLDHSSKVVKDLRGKDQKKLAQSLEHLHNILAKIDKGKGTLGALINNSELHDKIVGLLGDSPRNRYLKPLIRTTIKKQDQLQ